MLLTGKWDNLKTVARRKVSCVATPIRKIFFRFLGTFYKFDTSPPPPLSDLHYLLWGSQQRWWGWSGLSVVWERKCSWLWPSLWQQQVSMLPGPSSAHHWLPLSVPSALPTNRLQDWIMVQDLFHQRFRSAQKQNLRQWLTQPVSTHHWIKEGPIRLNWPTLFSQLKQKYVYII